MNKKIYLLLAVVFAFTSCNCQKQPVQANASDRVVLTQENMPKLEYVANTRGFFEKITIENKTVIVSSERENPDKGQAKQLSDMEAKELVEAFRKADLNALPTYKDPTQKRFYDGAAIAHLKVTFNGKTYQTVDFDHGFPPAEIENLIGKITSFGTKRE